MRYVRNPDLLVCWKAGKLHVERLGSGGSVRVSADVLRLLDLFDRPSAFGEAARRAGIRFQDRSALQRALRQCARLGLLCPEGRAGKKRSLLRHWKYNLAAAHYFAASRDIPYLKTEELVAFERRVARRRRPRLAKRFQKKPERSLPLLERLPSPLEMVMLRRRTVREFSKEVVSLQALVSIVRGTWGQTGWIDAGPLGRLMTKTSPSGGSLHPIECYVVAWRVGGLQPGIYHYDVRGDALRRLRAGDFRRAAVRAASGQEWIGRAAFVCIMTAVFERTLWKYANENAFRVLWLDAGHLAQTFCLLATENGLGPFQTAAIQDSYIEKLLGIDGVKEFPVYLCGAGVPRPTVR